MKVENNQKYDPYKVRNFFLLSYLDINKFFFLIIIILISGSIGYLVGTSNVFNKNVQPSVFKDYANQQLLQYAPDQVYNFDFYKTVVANLKDNYVDVSKIDDKKLFEGSIKGLVSGIGDPYTIFMNKDDYQKYKESLSGNLEGIGISINSYNGKFYVTDVFEGSPAQKNQVKKGFEIVSVNGIDVKGLTIQDLVTKIRGPSGTVVSIVFFDPINKSNVEKNITRDYVHVDSLKLREVNNETVVLKINRFTDSSLDQWIKLWDSNVNMILTKGYKNIILDLRGNGGGYSDAAVHAVSDFIPKDKLILFRKSRNNTLEIKSNRNPRLADKKVVILIDENTASASEIFAGALRHHNNYKLVGKPSFGKSTVQVILDIPDGSALKITTEYWLLPNGQKLDENNKIIPDIDITLDLDLLINKNIDNQLNKAIDLID